MKNKFDLQKFQLVSWMIFFACLGAWLFFIITRVNLYINADDASEMVYAKMILEEKSFFLSDWFYSTELRTIHAPILYAFFFQWISHWTTVRLLTYMILYGLLVLSYYLLCKSFDCKEYFPITAAVLFLPFSEDYFNFFLTGIHYVPYVTIGFFTIAFAEMSRKRNRPILNILGMVMALLSGMAGIRMTVMVYLPLFFCMVAEGIIYIGKNYNKTPEDDLKKGVSYVNAQKAYVGNVLLFAMASVVGYGINLKILSKICIVKSYNETSFIDFNLDNLSAAIAGIFKTFGYVNGGLFSSALVANFSAFVMSFALLISLVVGIKNREDGSYKRLSLFSLFGLAIYVMIFVFTNMDQASRYNIQILIFVLPLVAAWTKKSNLHSSMKHLLLLVLVVIVGIHSLFFYRNKILFEQNNEELMEIAKDLEAHGYHEGYATFWRANLVTELSNGTIEMWDWIDGCDVLNGGDGKRMELVTDIDMTDEWLQSTKHMTKRPKGKVCVVLTANEWESTPWREAVLQENILYTSQRYIVLGYDGYQELKAVIH